MNLLALAANHGYICTFIILLGSALGLPLPLSVVLLTAGSAAHNGSLHLPMLILVGWSAAVLGDTIMFFGGRLTYLGFR